MKISFCITCMNRLYNLKETFPKNLEIVKGLDCEFTLVNYNSQDGLDEWVHKNYQDLLDSGYLKYLYTKKPKYFEMSAAKNLAHNIATGDILCNLDADNFLTKEFVDFIIDSFTKNLNTVMCNGSVSGSGGRVVLPTKIFKEIGGYDEFYKGWQGFEHLDIVEDCIKLGLSKIVIPLETMPFIDQDMSDKFSNYENNNNTIMKNSISADGTRNKNIKLFMKDKNGCIN